MSSDTKTSVGRHDGVEETVNATSQSLVETYQRERLYFILAGRVETAGSNHRGLPDLLLHSRWQLTI